MAQTRLAGSELCMLVGEKVCPSSVNLSLG